MTDVIVSYVADLDWKLILYKGLYVVFVFFLTLVALFGESNNPAVPEITKSTE